MANRWQQQQPQQQQQQQQQQQGTNKHWDPVHSIYLLLFLPFRVQTNTGTPSLFFGGGGNNQNYTSGSVSCCWTPFWPLRGLDPAKRGLGPPNLRLASFSCCWTPFCVPSGPYPSKRGLGPTNLRLASFPAAGPLFVLSAARILQTGVWEYLT